MTVDDVDLDQRMVWVLGKGHRPRALPLGRKTAQALDRYLRVREEHRLVYLPNLWVRRNGPMTPSGVYQVVHDRARPRGFRRCIPTSSGTLSPPAGWRRAAMRTS
jgi:site-specific recombinase XerC